MLGKDDSKSQKRMEAQIRKIQEMFNKELEDITELNSKIIKM